MVAHQIITRNQINSMFRLKHEKRTTTKTVCNARCQYFHSAYRNGFLPPYKWKQNMKKKKTHLELKQYNSVCVGLARYRMHVNALEVSLGALQCFCVNSFRQNVTIFAIGATWSYFEMVLNVESISCTRTTKQMRNAKRAVRTLIYLFNHLIMALHCRIIIHHYQLQIDRKNSDTQQQATCIITLKMQSNSVDELKLNSFVFTPHSAERNIDPDLQATFIFAYCTHKCFCGYLLLYFCFSSFNLLIILFYCFGWASVLLLLKYIWPIERGKKDPHCRLIHHN